MREDNVEIYKEMKNNVCIKTLPYLQRKLRTYIKKNSDQLSFSKGSKSIINQEYFAIILFSISSFIASSVSVVPSGTL